MTTRHKDFGSEEVSSEPITFSVNGETFSAVPNIQGAFLLHFVNQAESDGGSKASAAIMDFYDRVLLPESLERFNAMCEDPDRIVSLTRLSEIIGWMVEQYTSRPTAGSSSSAPGPVTAGPTSTAPQYLQGSIPGA